MSHVIGKTQEAHYFVCVLCSQPFKALGTLWHFSSQTDAFDPPDNTCPRCGTPCQEITKERFAAIAALS